jgi:uncharacterized protein
MPAAMTTVQQYPLDRNKIKKKLIDALIGNTIFYGLLLVASALGAVFYRGWLWSVFILFIIIYVAVIAIQVWYQNEYFKRYFYNVEPDFLVIKKGVIMPHQTMLPYEKFQDVYMDQDLLDRMFGIYDVHVSTATLMSGYAAHIDGVNQQNAEAIRNMLLEKIRKKGVQDPRNTNI